MGVSAISLVADEPGSKSLMCLILFLLGLINDTWPILHGRVYGHISDGFRERKLIVQDGGTPQGVYVACLVTEASCQQCPMYPGNGYHC